MTTPAYQPPADFLQVIEPSAVPGLITWWRFAQSGEQFAAAAGEAYTLQSQSGPLTVVADPGAPFGGQALELQHGQWLNLPRAACPRLDRHGPHGHLTVIAWIKRARTSTNECEFIAGQWNETNRGRQYGLFLNIHVWGVANRVFGHLSHVGGPTPGYRYCMDGPMSAGEVAWDTWSVVALSYDGQQGFAWRDGRLDAIPGLNPYSLAGGLHDSGPGGSDFTVGAVDRSGEIGNFFAGRIASLAVYDRALSPAEIYALSQPGT